MHEAIDNKIIALVSAGRRTFSAIQGAFAAGISFRLIDRRLQALRKRRVLEYSRKTGWQVSPHDQT